jgi:hypothetical protein
MSKKKVAKKAKVKTYGPDMYERNQHGLLSNVDYEFNENGSVNWRAMIKSEFLYPNKDWFTLRNKEIPSSSEGLRDNQLLIMLAGIKELANLRGFKSVTFETQSPSDGYVVAKCKVKWISNYESFYSEDHASADNTIVYEDVANATLDNTDSFASKFLETIACNRAFVRCVRNFLNVHIVGADEIDKSKGKNDRTVSSSPNTTSNASPMTPIGLLQKTLDQKHAISEFDDFLEKLRELWKNKVYTCESIKDWKSWKDVPTREARKLTSILSK